MSICCKSGYRCSARNGSYQIRWSRWQQKQAFMCTAWRDNLPYTLSYAKNLWTGHQSTLKEKRLWCPSPSLSKLQHILAWKLVNKLGFKNQLNIHVSVHFVFSVEALFCQHSNSLWIREFRGNTLLLMNENDKERFVILIHIKILLIWTHFWLDALHISGASIRPHKLSVIQNNSF